MRTRETVLEKYLGTHLIKGSPPDILNGVQLRWTTSLINGTEGHWGYPHFPPLKDIGGDFLVSSFKRVRPFIPVGKIVRPGVPLEETYEGCVMPDLDYLGPVGGNLTDPSAWGATAYNRMRPDKPSFSGLNSIYELKDIPEMLRMRFIPHGLKDLGNFHLALQFGWLQLLRDCRNLVSTQMSAQDRLKQLIRDNGRPIRRKIMLEDVILPGRRENELGYPVAGTQPILTTGFYQGQSTTVFNLYDYRRTWASAQFRYWLPDGPRDINWTRNMLARIFGLRVTPAVVYNAIPWTWLADWFTNAGDVVANLSGGVADRLAADRYYLMQERGAYASLQSSNTFLRYGGLTKFTVSGTASENWAHKVRVKGDPFGLNTSQNTLSGMQLSILGALGLSRLR